MTNCCLQGQELTFMRKKCFKNTGMCPHSVSSEHLRVVRALPLYCAAAPNTSSGKYLKLSERTFQAASHILDAKDCNSP